MVRVVAVENFGRAGQVRKRRGGGEGLRVGQLAGKSFPAADDAPDHPAADSVLALQVDATGVHGGANPLSGESRWSVA